VAAVPELGTPRLRLLSGDPAMTLTRESRRSRMLIVGPRGSGGSTAFGPVAGQLLRRSACPTVFVHGNTALAPPAPGTVPSAGTARS
jgi:nucleotide-binding universal stress UspA family protein